MASLNQYINNLTGHSASYNDLKERVKSILIEIEDIGNELENRLDNVELNPERLEKIENQYQELNQLFKKHQVQTDEELIVIKDDLEKDLIDYSGFDEQIQKTKDAIKSQEQDLKKWSEKLSKNRKTSSVILEKKLVKLLSNLGLENASIKVSIKPSETYNSYGRDEIEFLFSANKGMPLRLLHKVASGGEMSRIMLAIKSTLAEFENLPTIIFDEIDTGVSGEIALKMGQIMSDMSNRMQVISITHLPQIASKGIQHLKVLKSVNKNSTETQIKELDFEERVIELSQMLGGNENSESAIAHAKSLLN
jgi:DNA repair protein RecN (Recombination protein N)